MGKALDYVKTLLSVNNNEQSLDHLEILLSVSQLLLDMGKDVLQMTSERISNYNHIILSNVLVSDSCW